MKWAGRATPLVGELLLLRRAILDRPGALGRMINSRNHLLARTERRWPAAVRQVVHILNEPDNPRKFVTPANFPSTHLVHIQSDSEIAG